MTETEYMGPFILVVYALLLLAMGLQFAFLTWLVCKVRPLTLPACAALAGFWVFMEWSRLLPCTGFTWNPTGLALTASDLSLQAASRFGIYGLSFLVIFVNLTALSASVRRMKKATAAWVVAALLPFAFGAFQQVTAPSSKETLSAVLVQPSLFPNERDFSPDQPEKWVSPIDQWDRILEMIGECAGKKNIELIVLPECAIPFGAYWAVYPLDIIEMLWAVKFGSGAIQSDFPPRGEKSSKKINGEWKVSNAFWLQALANHYDSEVIAGMDDADEVKRYNAAFHFKPQTKEIDRYEKRVLVPVGEYVPLRQWTALSRWVAETFGISESFDPGVEAKIFQGRVPMGISICMEETYSGIIRESCSRGVNLLINLTNDGWFPRSRLARQHFSLGILRAVENGVPSLRACSTGVTGGVDCYGRTLAISAPDEASALYLEIPLANVRTAYSFWGDSGIFILSGVCFVGFFLLRLKKKS
jgi:apolipoprotein N-acyltransferase